MTKMAKKITEEFISFLEIRYTFMLDSVLDDEMDEIKSTLEALIDSEMIKKKDYKPPVKINNSVYDCSLISKEQCIKTPNCEVCEAKPEYEKVVDELFGDKKKTINIVES